MIKKLLLIMMSVALGTLAYAQDETTLFSSQGKPTAYIADDSTIYLWSGKPVAYLYPDSVNDGLNIYGFNGKHLGWFCEPAR
jgi:4-fold beta-flower domain-containing protein